MKKSKDLLEYGVLFFICIGIMVSCAGLKSITSQENAWEKSDFYFVHLTDQHLYDKRNANEGYNALIKTINDLEEEPDFVLMGGDMVFDGCYNEKSDYLRWLEQFKSITNKLNMPWYPCMGNHDPFGLSSRRKCKPDDPDIGKKIIQDALDWPEAYYSFDHKGWHFVVLDCIFQKETESGPSYEVKIGEKQLEWLAYDLGSAGDAPKVAVMHVAAFYGGDQINADTNAKAMNPGMVINDNKELRIILERHGVKAILQGHCHHIENFMYNNVWYITSAAGSGAWWAGDWTLSPAGFTVLRCKGDELTWEHKRFHWKAYLDPENNLEKERTEQYENEKKEQQRLLELERKGIRK